jgi:hypothetical protein
VPYEEAPRGQRKRAAEVAARSLALHSSHQPQEAVDEQDPTQEQLEQRPHVAPAEREWVREPSLHVRTLEMSGVGLTDRASAAATSSFGHYPTFLRPEAPPAACAC